MSVLCDIGVCTYHKEEYIACIFSYNAKVREAEILKREITELTCSEEKFQALFDLLNAPFVTLGENEPRPGLELSDIAEAVSPSKVWV